MRKNTRVECTTLFEKTQLKHYNAKLAKKMTNLATFAAVGGALGAILCASWPLWDEYSYQTDKTRPRRAGTVPIPFFIPMAITFGIFGGVVGVMIGVASGLLLT